MVKLLACPKKNKNNYTYSLRNQKAGGIFGRKGQKLHIQIVVCTVTQKVV